MNLQVQKDKIEGLDLGCIGSSVERIELAERHRRIKLPNIYKEFLSICGDKAGQLFCGCNVELQNWNYINDGGYESYKSALNRDCPANLFFILEHHGYSYFYFDLEEGENPDIYILVHGDEVVHKIVGKLDKVLNDEIDRLVKSRIQQ